MREEGFDFTFDPTACFTCKGQCCVGESGYIWVTPLEITALSKGLGLEREEFIKEYLLKVGYRYTIKEEPLNDGFKCVFYDTTKQMCSVYEQRPTQCRTFPFWDYFKTNIEELEKECPAICRL